MKLRQLFENGGLIVPGVNTTGDVGPDEIKKQAAKFGNTVDKYGKPANTFHSKAHKNTNPNTLFNLGMKEAQNTLKLPNIDVGDEVMVGKFKNRKATVKGFDKDDNNQPVLKTNKGDQKLFKPRISKLMVDESVNYVKPQFDVEWEEATRYKEFKNIGKEKWIALAKTGDVVEYDSNTVKKINNTEAGDVKEFDKLHPKKQKRALQQISTGKVELPIVANYSDGYLELIGGNTRLTALMKATGKGKVWQFDVPDNLEEKESLGLSSKSEIYVDMDGVLVDFFGAWTKLMGVKNWKEIPDINVGLEKIRNTKDFWVNLEPTANANNLLGIIKTIKGSYKILSAPLADDPRVEPSKREWVEKHLKAFPPTEVIITSNKKQYAVQSDGTKNILIDDFGQNVAKWEGAGGIGFKHKDHKFERTAKNLQQHFKESTVNESDLKMKYNDFKEFVASKIAQPQAGSGRKEYDPALLKKIYELISGQDVDWDGKSYTIHDIDNSPRQLARRGRNPAREALLAKG